MKKIVKWYLSGFYKKPKGLKKPYNPILGETFRCYWEHPNGSKSYYIAEQGMHKVFSQKNFDFNYTFRFPFLVRQQSLSYASACLSLMNGKTRCDLTTFFVDSLYTIMQRFDRFLMRAFEATDVQEAQAKGCVNLSNKFR